MSERGSREEWIDVSVPVLSGMLHWPGEIPVQVAQTSSMEKGDHANVTSLTMSAHTGTHVDAPLHFLPEGSDVESIPLHCLTGDVRVIEIHHESCVTREEAERFELKEGEKVFFKTKNSARHWFRLPFAPDHIFIDKGAALYLAEAGVTAVGIDYLSVGGREDGAEVHKILLTNNVLIIEGLLLRHVSPGSYEMMCLPLRIRGADGAPARVLIRHKK